MERIQKVMAEAGVASRRQSEAMIAAGRVKVNGQLVSQLGVKVDPLRDQIEVDGKTLCRQETKVYVLLNKPAGYITTAREQFGRKKVTDLLHDVPARVYPVGRLDYDTEGLLLLTNDGDLTYALTHPKHEVAKTYLALVQGKMTVETMRGLCQGVTLEDGPTAPARGRIVQTIGEDTLVELSIHEGRNRQVRRMLGAVGHRVKKLMRTRLGFLTLGDLKPGEYRYLTAGDVKRLRALASERRPRTASGQARKRAGQGSMTSASPARPRRKS